MRHAALNSFVRQVSRSGAATARSSNARVTFSAVGDFALMSSAARKENSDPSRSKAAIMSSTWSCAVVSASNRLCSEKSAAPGVAGEAPQRNIDVFGGSYRRQPADQRLNVRRMN